MRIFFIWNICGLMIKVVSMVQFNRPCTFTSGENCQWQLGRRWQVAQLDEETDDQVLMAMGHNNDDERLGYTDSITSSWLSIDPTCSFQVRLQFQFNIENDHDRIELFLMTKNGTRIQSIGQWHPLSDEKINGSEQRESHWQQANLTFDAAEEFRIDIEVRHIADDRNDSSSWFALDDILIESCPSIRFNTFNKTSSITRLKTFTRPPFFPQDNWTLFDRTFVRFRWKFNDSVDSSSINEDLPLAPRFVFLNFLLYFLCALFAVIFVTMLLVLIISIYRKYCLPSSALLPSTIHYRYRSSRRKKTNRHEDQHGRDTRTEKTMVTMIRTCS